MLNFLRNREDGSLWPLEQVMTKNSTEESNIITYLFASYKRKRNVLIGFVMVGNGQWEEMARGREW